MQKLEIQYQELSKVQMACQQRGMKEGDNSSFWDWIEPSSYQTRIFVGGKDKFSEAVSQAALLIEGDVWRCPRIFLSEWEGDKKTGSWEDKCFWEIEEGSNPNFDEPDGEL